MCRRTVSMMRLLPFIKSKKAGTLRGLCGRSQESFRSVGFYTGVDSFEGIHEIYEVRV